MTAAEMTPHRCPVCAGRGQVPAAFYEGTYAGRPDWVMQDTLPSGGAPPAMMACRACDKGVVWAMVLTTPGVRIEVSEAPPNDDHAWSTS